MFYEQLQMVIEKKTWSLKKKPPRHDTILLIGDLNAKIGSKLEGEDGIAGRHRVQRKRNDNGEELFHSVA